MPSASFMRCCHFKENDECLKSGRLLFKRECTTPEQVCRLVFYISIMPNVIMENNVCYTIAKFTFIMYNIMIIAEPTE